MSTKQLFIDPNVENYYVGGGSMKQLPEASPNPSPLKDFRMLLHRTPSKR